MTSCASSVAVRSYVVRQCIYLHDSLVYGPCGGAYNAKRVNSLRNDVVVWLWWRLVISGVVCLVPLAKLTELGVELPSYSLEAPPHAHLCQAARGAAALMTCGSLSV
jgi:hypothetical protein